MIEPHASVTFHDSLIAAIPSLISAATGGAIAFGAAAATNRANNQRLATEYAIQKAERQREDRIQRGEELYVLLHNWFSNAAGHYLAMAMSMQGKLTFDQVLDMDIKRGKSFGSKYESSRIELYIHSYFPTCIPLHGRVMTAIEALNDVDRSYKHAYQNGYHDGCRFLPEYVRLQKDFEKHIKALQAELIVRLRDL